MAVVGGFITLIIAALFFRQLTVEVCTTLLYWLWNIVDFPRTHEYAAWRINLLARTHNNAPDVRRACARRPIESIQEWRHRIE